MRCDYAAMLASLASLASSSSGSWQRFDNTGLATLKSIIKGDKTGTEITLDECKEYCLALPECKGFTFPSGECLPRNDLAIGIDEELGVSLFKLTRGSAVETKGAASVSASNDGAKRTAVILVGLSYATHVHLWDGTPPEEIAKFEEENAAWLNSFTDEETQLRACNKCFEIRASSKAWNKESVDVGLTRKIPCRTCGVDYRRHKTNYQK